ncbi:alginate lyase family protein [Coraliomargarita algicola]|uniref:Alginate lyase family protein n=1 Tax=Coraliomargarita algicola TaxID=3092156 RepID=A0ABZ0RQR5_9BACT|nr:alginate lyase family protein [Coraliomargarita sp. J2-16]WPJ97237.1 alginate lyase family protein [Coraliomargarita sp. J2-16]
MILTPMDLAARQLNLMRHDMGEIATALNEADKPRAQSLLLSRWTAALERARDLQHEATEADLKTADLLLENKLSLLNSPLFDLGDPIDWTRFSDEHPQMTSHLTYMRWSVTLGKAYYHTGNEAYAEKLISVYESFLEGLPYGTPKLEWLSAHASWEVPYSTCSNGETKSPGGQWHSLSCHARMDHWLNALSYITASSALSYDVLWRILSALMTDHAQLIVANPRENTPNQYISNSVSLIRLAVLFPEFRVAESYFAIGWNRFKNAINSFVFPDGACMERSLNYNQGLPRALLKVIDLFQNTSASSEYTDHLRSQGTSIALVLARLRTPDGNTLQVAKTHPNKIDSLIRWWGEGFGSSECQRLAGEKFPNPQTEPSFYLPYGGYCVLQSDWSPRAFQLFFKNSGMAPGHMHEDCLNVTFFAEGHPVLIEAGNYNYSDTSELDRSMTDYCKGTRGHNGITVDGKGQRRESVRFEKSDRSRHQTPDWSSFRDRLSFRAAEGTAFAFVEGSYQEGFGDSPDAIAVNHTRKLIWVKELGVLVIDELTPQDAMPHHYEQYWHLDSAFDPASIQFDGATGVLHARSDHMRLQISTSAPVAYELKRAQDLPSQGWHCYEYNQRRPSPDVVFRFQGVGPQAFVTLIRTSTATNLEVMRCRESERSDSNQVVLFRDSDGRACRCEQLNDEWVISLLDGDAETSVLRIPQQEEQLPEEIVSGHSKQMRSLAVDENPNLSAYFKLRERSLTN